MGKGPALYSPVASRGRNYHGMNWDVRSPLNDPKYDTMAKSGEQGPGSRVTACGARWC